MSNEGIFFIKFILKDNVNPMLAKCWISFEDDNPTLTQDMVSMQIIHINICWCEFYYLV